MIATVAAAVIAAALVVTQLTGTSNGAKKEVYLQAASTSGPEPFTPSVARDNGASASPTATASQPSSVSASPLTSTRSVEGSAPGLYGGTRDMSSCDVGQLVRFLTSHPDKGRAWAGVEGIDDSTLPAYLHSLTPVVLRADTRVTNHGFRNGAATSFQSVLQAGTAVMVDGRGVPRVRCACGNPLLPPVALQDNARRIGQPWPSYQPSNVVVVTPAAQPIIVIVIIDINDGSWIGRRVGDGTGRDDRVVPAPHSSSPGPSASFNAPSSSPSSPSTSLPSSGPLTSNSPGSTQPPTGGPSPSASLTGPAVSLTGGPATGPPT